MNLGINFDLENDKLLLFLDILGFSDIINNNKQITAETRDILIVNFATFYNRTLISYSTENQKKLGIKFLWMSDTIVASTSIDNVQTLLKIYVDLTHQLLCCGLMVRGAVTIGQLHHKDNIWGPAICEAARIEKNIAKYPRLVMDSETVKQILPHLSNDFAIYLQNAETENFYFFNFLEHIITRHKDYIVQTIKGYIQGIQDYFEIAQCDDVREKSQWFAKELVKAIAINSVLIDEAINSYIKLGRPFKGKDHHTFKDMLQNVLTDN